MGGRNEVSERKRRATRRQMRRVGGEEKKTKESKRLNLVICLKGAFLIALPIHAGVLAKQTVKLFSKTVLYCFTGNSIDNKTNTVVYFQVYFIIHGL